jgi:hypothetical protein
MSQTYQPYNFLTELTNQSQFYTAIPKCKFFLPVKQHEQTFFSCFLKYRRVSLYARVTLLKKSSTSNTKFPFKTVYLLGVRGMMSSHIVYDYTTNEHKTYTVYTHTHIYIIHTYTHTHTHTHIYIYIYIYICIFCITHISIQYFYTIYLFIFNAIQMQETHIHSFWCSSLWQDCDGLATETNTLVPDLVFCFILSALTQTAHSLLWVSQTLQHMSTIHSPFSTWLNFSSVLIVFHYFALGLH